MISWFNVEGQNERLECRYMRYQSKRRTSGHACIAILEIAEINADSHVHLRRSQIHRIRSTVSTKWLQLRDGFRWGLPS